MTHTTRIGFGRESGLLHLCRWSSITGWTPLCHTPDIQPHTALWHDQVPTCLECWGLADVRNEVYFGTYWMDR